MGNVVTVYSRMGNGEKMFEIGEYIVYGNNGVCQVASIGPIAMDGVPKDKLFYTLVPCYIRGSMIYAPVDNTRTVMRKVMSHDEAMELIQEIPTIEQLLIQDEKKRDREYRDVIATCDPKALVQVIKTIYDRKMLRLSEGKKVTSADTKYFHIAEDNLYGELAISLQMEKGDVQQFIAEKITV